MDVSVATRTTLNAQEEGYIRVAQARGRFKTPWIRRYKVWWLH